MSDIPISAISCRIWPREVIITNEIDSDGDEIEIVKPKDDRRSLYFIILSVLPNYRRLGVASNLLEEAVRRATEANPELYSIYLHTPADNEMAINFYKKLGFEQKEMIPGYYKAKEEEGSFAKDGIILERMIIKAEETN